MNNSDLSYKLKYILKELGLNKKQLLEECRKYNPSLSKPTLLNAINNKNKNTSSIDTLSAIVNVCKMSNHPKLKYISFDYLLNENIQDVEANNITVYQEVGLNDDAIDRLKLYNTPIICDKMNIVNYFLFHTSGVYWRYLDMLKRTYEIKDNINNIESILEIFDDGWFLFYLEDNFKNIYDIYKNLKNKDKKVDLKKLDELFNIVVVHLKYELNRTLENTYESMKKLK